MKYLLFFLLLVAVIITAGCVGGNQNSVVTPSQTPLIATITSTLTQQPSPQLESDKLFVSSTTVLEKKGTIQVTSTPSGVEVYLDNEYRGTTPNTIKDASIGSHIVELRDRNYQIWNTTITVSSESTSYISTKLNPILDSSQTVPSHTQSEIEKEEQEAIYRAVELSTPDILLNGNVYGSATTPSNGIDQIKFTIKLCPGAPSLDLHSMNIIISEPNTEYIKTLSYAASAAADTNFGASSPTLSSYEEKVEISIILPTDSLLQPNKAIAIEIRPATRTPISFSKLSPATIQEVNVLQ